MVDKRDTLQAASDAIEAAISGCGVPPEDQVRATSLALTRIIINAAEADPARRLELVSAVGAALAYAAFVAGLAAESEESDFDGSSCEALQ